MKKIIFTTALFFHLAAFAKSPPVPEKKPEIPEIDVSIALPPDLEQDAMIRPVLKKTAEEVALLAPAPQIRKLCNADAFDRLMAGTKIYIRILGHDDISRESLIGPKGTVTIPMVGEVMAEGETTATLAALIAQKLEAAYLMVQGVEVEIVQYPPIYVTGLAASPGVYDYRPRLNVRQAVTLAGGFGVRARTSEVRILRNKPGNPLEQMELHGDEDTQVLPGDTIEVLRRWF